MVRSILGLVLSGFVLSVAMDASAATVPLAGPKSFSAICNRAPTTASAGPDTLRPGRYYNPLRLGQGWDFFWYGPPLPNQSPGASGQSAQNQVGNRLFVVWYTHEWVDSAPGTRTLRPVWFGAVGDTVWSSATQTYPEWTGTLYRFTLVEAANASGGPETYRQWLPDFLGSGSPNVENATPVGTVTLYFGGAGGLTAGTRPAQVAARWQLNSNYGFPATPTVQSAPADDCLTNFIADGNTYTPDYHRSGVYLDRSAAGWFWTPIFWTQGSVKYEHHGFAYFDALTPNATGQLSRGGQPRWLVGFPEQTTANHVCTGFWAAHGGSLGPHWPQNSTMCMARVWFEDPSPSEAYVPWLTSRPYKLAKVAALRRSEIPDASISASPTSSIAVRPLVSDGSVSFARYYKGTTLSDPDFLEIDAANPKSARVEKVIGLTRARLVGGGITTTNSSCTVATGISFTPGTCDTYAHWATEGAYLNLTVRLKRNSVGPVEAVEISRGFLRSPWDGYAVSLRTSQPGNLLSRQPTSGPLAGETVTLQVFENPSATTPLASSAEHEVLKASRCNLADTPTMLDTPPTVGLASSPTGDALTVTATIAPPSNGSPSKRPTGIRYRLYEAISPSGSGVGNLSRYVAEQQFALSQNTNLTLPVIDTASFSQLEPGKLYMARVDLYNECNFVTAISSPQATTPAVVPDQTLAESPQPVTTHDPTVGLVPQTSGVSGGAATFEFPIEVPPGIQGMQPGLSLGYSSRSGNSIAGMGVSLSGLSSIHRCPQTRATDGAPRAVDFSNNDRLCLDGQRLIALNGAPYGQAGTTYRTEIDQYLRVTQVTGDLALNSRSATFLVELKSGELMYFGGSDAGGRVWYVPVATTAGGAVDAALSWVVRRRANRAGNFIEYRYQDFGRGELLATSLLYTGSGSTLATGGTAGTREVRLAYESRPDPTSSYIAGAETRQSQRLTSIRTFVGAAEARQYNFSYGSTPSASTGRSLLRSVQLCARDVTAPGSPLSCLPVTLVDWQETPTPRIVRGLDFGSAATAPYPYSPQTYFNAFRGQSGSPTRAPVYEFRGIGDLDGDGISEHLITSVIPNNSASLRVQLTAVTSDRQVSGALTLAPLDAVRIESVTAGKRAIDLNNDGRSELWFAADRSFLDQACTNQWACQLGVLRWNAGTQLPPPGTTPQPPLSTYMTSSAAQFVMSASDDTTPATGPLPPISQSRLVQFSDADGDGLLELFALIWPSQTPTTDGTQTACPQVARSSNAPIELVNGPEIRIYKNVSTAAEIRFLRDPAYRMCIPRAKDLDAWDTTYYAHDVLGLDDLDGDGLVDLKLRPNANADLTSSRSAGVWFGQNSGSFSFAGERKFSTLLTTTGVPEAYRPTLDHPFFGDFNGDGLQDIYMRGSCRPNGSQTSERAEIVWFNTGGTQGGKLFGPPVLSAAANGQPINIANCNSDPQNVPVGPDFTAIVDTDGDGRDELVRPTSFALRQCVYLPDPNVPPEEGNYLYFCPEAIRGAGSPPAADPGFQFPPGTGHSDFMYTSGYADWDRSLYHAGGSSFSVDNTTTPAILRVRASSTTVITDRSGRTVSDAFGDSLPDGILHFGCPLLGDACVVPNMLRDLNGQPLVAGRIYVHEHRGVLEDGSTARPLDRAPALPDLARQLRALAPTGHVDANVRIARWSYDPLSSRAGRVSGSTLPPLYDLPPGLQAPFAHFYFTSSMPVVSAYLQSNGNLKSGTCAGGTVCLQHGFTRTQYGYREAQYSAEGRGFRGFRTIIEQTDGLSPDAAPVVTPGLRTTTVFKQTYPLSSALECQFVTSTVDPIGPVSCPAALPEQSSLEGTTLLKASTATTTGLLRGCSAVGSPSCYWDVQTTQERTRAYEPNNGRWVSETTASSTYDTYGNALTQQSTTVQVDGQSRTATSTKSTASTFVTTTTPFWFVNQLTRVTTTQGASYAGYAHPPTLPGSLTKTSTQLFDYDINATSGEGSWQVQCTATFLGSPAANSTCLSGGTADPNWQFRARTLTRDAYRNPTSTVTQLRNASGSSSGFQQRQASFEWGDGYFKVSEANRPTTTATPEQNHRTCYTVDARYGTPTRVTRLMNSSQTCAAPAGALAEETTLDAFGRAVRVIAPSTTESEAGTGIVRTIRSAQDTVLSRQWCSISATPRPCGTLNAVYRELKEQRGSPRQESYLDAAGRPILAGTTASDDTTSTPGIATLIATTTAYDDLGRTLGVYGPSRSGSQGNTVDHYHDRFGRLRVKAERRVRLDAENSSAQQHLVTIYTANRATIGIEVKACNVLTAGAVDADEPNPVTCAPLTNVPSGTQTSISMSRTMDPAGRPLVTVDAKGGETTFQYDGAGSVTAIRDADGVFTTAAYDALGRRLSVQDPNQGASTFDYNGLGEVVATTNSRGQTVTFVRDLLGRVTQRVWREEAGAQQSANAHAGTDRYDYDSNGFGLLWRERRDVYSLPGTQALDLIATPDPTGPNIAKIESFERSTLFDALYRPSTVTTRLPLKPGALGSTTPETYVTETRYDGPTGRVKQRIMPRGVSVGYTYNRHGYPEREFIPGSGEYLRRVTARDAFGNESIVSLSNDNLRRRHLTAPTSGLTTNICYDQVSAGNSSDCADGSPLKVNYLYDAFGNVLRQQLRGSRPTASQPVEETYTYDELHRVKTATYRDLGLGSAAAPVQYDYSATGNLLMKTDYSVANGVGTPPAYTYGDVERKGDDRAGPNAVESVRTPGLGCETRYRYDRSGNQIAQEVLACTTNVTARRQWIDYTVDNLPKWMQLVHGALPAVGGYPQSAGVALSSRFQYSPDGQRYAQTVNMGNPSRSTIYIGSYERDEVVGSVQPYVEHRYNLAPGVLLVHRERDDAIAPRSGLYYVMGDRLGSTSTVVRGRDRAIVDRHGFGPFGEPRDGNWLSNASRTLHPVAGDADLNSDVPPILSSTPIWSPIPQREEIGREEALFRREDHRVPA
jgi:YD repeat-containing protein